MARIYILDEVTPAESIDPDVKREIDHSVELILRDDDIQSFYYTDDSFLSIIGQPLIGLPLGARLTLKDILPGVPVSYRQHVSLVVIAMQNAGLKALDQVESNLAQVQSMLLMTPTGAIN